MRRAATSVITSCGVAIAPPLWASCRLKSSTLDKAAVATAVKQLGLFDAAKVDATVASFITGLDHTLYNSHVSQEESVAHVQALLTASAREKIGDPFEYSHEDEESAFYICRNNPVSKLGVTRKLAMFLTRGDPPEHLGTITRSYLTNDGQLAVYTTKTSKFVNPNPGPNEVNVDQLATQGFLTSVSPGVREVCQRLMQRLTTSVYPAFEVSEVTRDVQNFTIATTVERTNYIASMVAVFQEIPGTEVCRCACFTFSNGVHVYSFDLKGANPTQIQERASLVGLLPNRPFNTMTRLHEAGQLTCEETVFIDAAVLFALYFTPSPTSDDFRHIRSIVAKEPNGVNRLNNLRLQLSQETMSERYMGSVIGVYPEFAKLIYEDFRLGSTEERREKIAETIVHRLREDQRSNYDVSIFKSFLKFNEVILKHNFFKLDKAALAFRLNPTFLKDLEYARVPHGVFMLAGGQWRGFHIRFTDIARGGVRMILSKEKDYRKNKRSVFQENYNLAYTQLLKNKDIPEGGAKGTILVSSRYLNRFNETDCKRLFLQYVDGLLSVIIPNEKGVVDHLKQEEILFLGPDENTAGSFPAAGALYSKQRGYSAWTSFTTGKDPQMGGIPHDVYGMTTHSVRTFVRCIYEKLGMDEHKLRKFQTGGPDGDLGSNEILRSAEVMIGLVDVSASLHDPHGICREELTRLAEGRLPLRAFDRSKLSNQGFLVLTEDKNVMLPDGTLVADGSLLRDEFHLLPYSDADVFVPCGGRPCSITLENVGRLLHIPDADGEGMLAGKYANCSQEQLKFRIIVEGANLFISQDARLALERCGVTLIKDAAANKGGVTSSSLEVFAGLALSNEEHRKYMFANSADDATAFYKSYVLEIKERIQHNAEMEFNAIWREWEKNPATPKTIIVDELSSKNVMIRADMLGSDIFKDKALVRRIMCAYTPKTLQEVVPMDVILQRVPENYQHAICAMWLASRYVYTVGAHGNEFDFFKFLTGEMRGLHDSPPTLKP